MPLASPSTGRACSLRELHRRDRYANRLSTPHVSPAFAVGQFAPRRPSPGRPPTTRWRLPLCVVFLLLLRSPACSR
jgi:hypothetical protein